MDSIIQHKFLAFATFLRKWWTWQSFNKAILLSFPSPERDKECILQRGQPSTDSVVQPSPRTSRWRAVNFRSSWAPNENTYYLRFSTHQRSPRDCFKLDKSNNMRVDVLFLYVCMIFWRRCFSANFFQDCCIHLLKRKNMGKTSDTLALQKKQMTRQWSSSSNEERAYSTNFFVKKQPKQSNWTKVWFHKQSQQPFIRYKKTKGTKHVDLNYMFKSKSIVSGFAPNPTFQRIQSPYSSNKIDMFFYHLWWLHSLPPIPWHPKKTSNSQSSATLGVSLIGICAKGQI